MRAVNWRAIWDLGVATDNALPDNALPDGRLPEEEAPGNRMDDLPAGPWRSAHLLRVAEEATARNTRTPKGSAP